jgi:D-sedoheptulose 7-phosphate isomerase
MKESTMEIFNGLFEEYPDLETCKEDIQKAFVTIKACYENDKMVLICGNGGSAADAEHIVGELMKGFRLKRKLCEQDAASIRQAVGTENNHGVSSEYLSDNLQGALPAVSLVSQTALATAFANDVAADLIYAQQVYGYRKLAGALIGISASGNAKNVANAAGTAKAFGIPVIGLTGKSGGILKEISDITIKVPSVEVYRIQEYHLPVYHALCAMLEEEFFG